jgi:tetratricopeptide (TPR) repeat protein
MNSMPTKYSSILIPLALVLITFIVFYQVHSFNFINYDDNVYVYENPHVQAGITPQSVKWAFTTGYANFWHPLTWLSHMLDWELFGANPAGHHLTTLFFHIANTLLLFIVLKQMTQAPWRSAFVATLFALHPLHVESVAWVTERKDVLSTFFWLLTMCAYVRYVNHRKAVNYLLIVLFFILGMMAKPMLVTLPFVLMLLDYWPLNRFQNSKFSVLNSVIEKIPLFVISAVSSVIVMITQRAGGALTSTIAVPLKFRIINALISYVTYIEKMFWPSRLAVFYPYFPSKLTIWSAVAPLFLLLVISVIVLLLAKRHRYLVTGWLWYLGTLVPVIGLVQIGSFAFADRFTYITLTGLFIIIAWGIGELSEKWPYRKIILWPASLAVLSVLAICSYLQTGYWKDSITLYQHALKVTEDNSLAHINIALPLFEQGRIDEAIRHMTQAIQIAPKSRQALNALGLYLYKAGRIDEAADCFQKVLEIDPAYAEAHFNIASILMDKGDYAAAVKHYRIALTSNDTPLARRKLGLALLKLGMFQEAITEYRKALSSMSGDPDVLNELGYALDHTGKSDEAIDLYNKALLIAPEDIYIHLNFGLALTNSGRFKEAAKEYEKILLLDPNNATAHNDFGVALSRLGKLDQAIEHFKEALKIRPGYKRAKTNLDIILAEKQKLQNESAEDTKK